MGSSLKSRVKILALTLLFGLSSVLLLSACEKDQTDETVVNSSTTSPTETTTVETTGPTEPGLSTRLPIEDMTDERYADLSNEPMSWWYRVPGLCTKGLGQVSMMT